METISASKLANFIRNCTGKQEEEKHEKERRNKRKFEYNEIPEMVHKISLLKMKANQSTALNEQHIV
ncbi:MAG: hypothetical protein LGB66_02205 [Sulfurovum sp.]|nr:hypothetical protein [Sulfurovum sp.]